MSDVQKIRRLIREEIKNIIGEQDGLDKLDVKLPAQAQRFLNKAVSAIKGANLNRRKQVAALAKIDASISPVVIVKSVAPIFVINAITRPPVKD